MFGMTAGTAWELEAERRVELAHAGRTAYRPDCTPAAGGAVLWLRSLFGSMPEAPPVNWKDVRT